MAYEKQIKLSQIPNTHGIFSVDFASTKILLSLLTHGEGQPVLSRHDQ